MIREKIFSRVNSQHGGMLVELLLSVALVAMVIPFLFQFQSAALRRSENVVIAREMENIQDSLERYIVANRETLLRTVGKNITRVQMDELADFGLNTNLMEHGHEYQLRIVKSNDGGGHATLQGVVVMTDDEITPLRTREIVETSAGQIGFVDASRAYGAYGAFRADTIDLGIPDASGIIAMTPVNRDNALYLWRVPSNDTRDATMQVALNLGGHDIANMAFLNAYGLQMDEMLTIGRAATTNLIFNTRPTVDGVLNTKNATVSGTLSADSRAMDVSGTFKLADVGKFTSFTTDDLWVSNMTLGGLSIASDVKAAILRVNDSVDMTAGRITALYVTVGFAGSITPRLIVTKRLQDSINPAYYWDVKSGDAHMMDMTLVELNRMASLAARDTRGDTTAYELFATVATNKNATVADFMNAISEIQTRVRAKYSLLKLE